MSISKQQFKNLVNLDVREDVEQDYKGLNYLSWASAYQLMMEQDPEATYEVVKAPDGMPYFSRGETHMVFTRVTMFGTTKEMWLPIMDNKKNSVKAPSSREISDNIMRCLVKNIAMFGIGLRLFKKEGLDEFQADDAILNLIAKLMKELGLSKDELEELAIQTCGKDNIRLLTKDEAEDMVKELKNIRRQKQRSVSNATTENPVKTTPVETPVIQEPTPAPATTPVVAPTKESKTEVEVAAENPPVAPTTETLAVEVQVEKPVPAPQPTVNATDLLSADQYKEITSLYREKKLTKEQLKLQVVTVAPGAKGIKELTAQQADAVIANLKALGADAQ